VLLVTFVVLSFFADSGASGLGVITDTVAEWQAGQLISVVNEQTDPGGFRIALRGTVYDGDPGAIKPDGIEEPRFPEDTHKAGVRWHDMPDIRRSWSCG
jgi:hypothetical protein